MQFKHPELLWGLLLLLIPIIIHLFQLRRFKKTPFTNVAMLQKVVSESRKSSTLKKWLLLLTRLLLLACIVLAFAQPFSAKETALKPEEIVIYVDNSFSMQAQQNGQSLFKKAVQEVIQHNDEDRGITLFTNDRTFKNTGYNSIKSELLSLPYTHLQLRLEQVLLKAKTLFSEELDTERHLIVISDFQQRFIAHYEADSIPLNLHLVKMEPQEKDNIAIDSLYVGSGFNDQMSLKVIVSGVAEEERMPVSLFNGNKLIAKSAVEGNKSKRGELEFSIPSGEAIKGKLQLQDNALAYDNRFYFNIDAKQKIKVLVIGNADASFLKKIYTEDSCEFVNYPLEQLNYSALESQNLIIINEVPELPESLQAVLKSFVDNGGSLLFVPNTQGSISSYNTLLQGFGNMRFQEVLNFEQNISTINFAHPLFENVFEKKVNNFEYPKVKSYYRINNSGSPILSYTNGTPLLSNHGNVYVFSASLNTENSNFKGSPLIVPTLYNIAALSLRVPDLYQTIGSKTTIDIATQLEKDNIVKLTNDNLEFIPLQQSFSNKLSLTFEDLPKEDGIFSVLNKRDTLQHISFNHDRAESQLSYPSLDYISSAQQYASIPQLFEDLDESNAITDYWKWFVIFALIFALLELLIQKTLA